MDVDNYFLQTYIENMSGEEFETHKTALATKKLEKPKQLAKLTNRFWGEISSRHYNFDRVEMEVEYLSTLKKADVLDFYKVRISNSRLPHFFEIQARFNTCFCRETYTSIPTEGVN